MAHNKSKSKSKSKRPHLVVVCGVLYPNPSPTGLCAYRYATLLTVKYKVEFIALSSNGKEEDRMYEGLMVHILSSKRLTLEHRTTGWISKAIHLVGSIQLKFSLLGNLGWFSKSAYRKLEGIHHSDAIDAVLTVCSPLSAHIAGARFKEKHPEVWFCAYTVDPYAIKDRIVPFFRNFKDFVSLERKMSKKADCLLLSEEAFSTRQDIYGDIPHKVALPYLLPKSQERMGDKYDNENVHCVYAGSFYRDIRNPEFMLKVFSALKEDHIFLHLYSAGCDELVKKYSASSTRIESNGYVTQEELQRVYASSDFLIGVGNAMNDFLPSKTYEYLSLRRPIVFFNPKGFDNKVLSLYPHSLQLSDDMPVEAAVDCLKAFVAEERGKSISEEELNEIYQTNTVSYVRNVLLSRLQKTKSYE